MTMDGTDFDESRAAILRARVLRVAAVRAIEEAAKRRFPSDSLMERAGEAVAAMALTMASERVGPIVVLAGPGNNGGDALVAARVLRVQGVDVRVARLDATAPYQGDALTAWTRWQEAAGDRGGSIDVAAMLASASLVIDGLFGIGFNRAPSGTARAWIEAVNATPCPVLAIDIASGVDADTGRVADIAIEADRTLTFIGDKPGLHTGDGVDFRGALTTDLLGIERDDDSLHDASIDPVSVGALNRPALFRAALKPRRLNSHKGSFGSVAVVGGNDGMVGAALLASRMALHAGAGRVYVRLLARGGPGLDGLQPELMLRTSLDGVDANAMAIGPGLGYDDEATAAIEHALATDVPLVIDADALNGIAADASLAAALSGRRGRGLAPAVLTPHPLEAARLLGTDAKDVAADRIGAALHLARQTSSIVVLKGAGTIIAEPAGTWVINPTGNPALATGGTGDVLCGLVGALLAQKIDPSAAARAATWLHGRAADDLVASGVGPTGVTASELIMAIRAALNRLTGASRRTSPQSKP